MTQAGWDATTRRAGRPFALRPALPLVLLFLFAVGGLGGRLPLQGAAWLTFLAILVTPGYLLGEILTWKEDFDGLERLALAFPLGMAVMAPAGISAMLLHLTLQQFVLLWYVACGLLFVGWWCCGVRTGSAPQPSRVPWAWSELAMLYLLGMGFVVLWPALTAYKIEGDGYTFLAFVRDALTGQPMSATEPLFGTTLAPGVRLLFNQTVPLWALWSHLARADVVDLTATASRSMFAVWAILAAYMLGKAAGEQSRRFGLFVASIQLLIYMSGPFWREDNVSILFLERINADKFLVSITMLPVTFALCIRFLHTAQPGTWAALGLTAFAVSTIHPLVSVALAIAVCSFGGLHLLLNLRRRAAWRRVVGLMLPVAVALALPAVQFWLARGGGLAPTYPVDFAGWSLDRQRVTVLPFLKMTTLDWYGPLPELTQLDARSVETATNPFLVWRFALNMDRRRLLLSAPDRYISDPTLIFEPPYLLSLLLLPVLGWRLRSALGRQFALATALGLLFTLYNPIVTPLLGAVAVPWLLWRLIWVLPYALIIAMVLDHVVHALSSRVIPRIIRGGTARDVGASLVPLGLLLGEALLSPAIVTTLREQRYGPVGPTTYPTPFALFDRLQEDAGPGGSVTVAADQGLSVTLPAHVANAAVIGHRIFNTSELFPRNRQVEALQRLIDQATLFGSRFLTGETLAILRRYEVRYVIASSGSDLDVQLRLATQWFEWLADDHSYSLYAVREIPGITHSIRGNQALLRHAWEVAQRYYKRALEENEGDLLALYGLAESYHALGHIDEAVRLLQAGVVRDDLPILRYRLGQLYLERGMAEEAAVQLRQAVQAAPSVARFYMALGDACLQTGDRGCADAQYRMAGAVEVLPDEMRLTTLANLWWERGDSARALSYAVQAVRRAPSFRNLLALVDRYQEAEQFKEAEALLRELRKEYPFAPEVVAAQATVQAAQQHVDEAVSRFDQAIWLYTVQGKDAVEVHLARARTLLSADRFAGARDEIDAVLALQPHNTAAYLLLGAWYSAQQDTEQAIRAYKKVLDVDPAQVHAYASIAREYRRDAAPITEELDLFVSGTQANPEQGALFLALGERLWQQGETEAAINAYRVALEALQIDDLPTQFRREPVAHSRAVAFARLAAAHEDLAEVQIAMHYYRAAVAAAPSETWNHVALADAMWRHNDPDGAEEQYRQVLQRDPTAIEAYLGLARLLARRGNRDEANAMYQEALRVPVAQVQRPAALIGVARLGAQSLDSAVRLGSGSEVKDARAPLHALAEEYLALYRRSLEPDEVLGGVHALGRLYQATGQRDRAVQLYQTQIAEIRRLQQPPLVRRQLYLWLGEAYLAGGEWESAVDAYRQARAIDPWSIAARTGLARALRGSGDLSAAVRDLREVIHLVPAAASPRLELASMLEAQGNHEEALAIYQSVVEAHPGNVTANLALARAWQAKGRWTDAETSYEKALALAPADSSAHMGLATLYAAQARYEEARARLQRAAQLDHTDPEPFLALGALLLKVGAYRAAEDAYHEARRRDTEEWRAYSGLAQVHQGLGQRFKAEKDLEQAAGLNDVHPQPLLHLAALYQAQGRLADALQTLQAATTRFPRDLSVHFALAALYDYLSLPHQALHLLRQVAKENPTSVAALARHAEALRAAGQVAEAHRLYLQMREMEVVNGEEHRLMVHTALAQGAAEEALVLAERGARLAPADHRSWILTAHAALAVEDQARAEAAFRQATVVAPAAGSSWEELGKWLQSQGRSPEAARMLKRATVVDPTYLPAYGALIDLYRATGQTEPLVETIRAARAVAPAHYLPEWYAAREAESRLAWDEARAAWERAIQNAPGVRESYLQLGTMLERVGRYDEAAEVYRQVRALGPAGNHWEIHFGLGRVSRALGDVASAIRHLQRASALSAADAGPALALASLYEEQNRPVEAEQVLRDALHHVDDRTPVRVALADFYHARAMPEQALEQLRQALEEAPGEMEVLVRYGDVLRLQGRLQEAEARYQQATEGVHPTAAGYRALARAHRDRGAWQEAVAAAAQGVALAPNDGLGWMLQGEMEAGSQHGDPLHSLQKATEVEPTSGAAWHALGRALLAANRIEEALTALERGVAGQPTYLPLYGSLIEAYALLGRVDKAQQAVDAARQIAPHNYQSLLHAAQLAQSQQRWEDARVALEQAAALAPGQPEPLLAYAGWEQAQGHLAGAIAWHRRAWALRPGRPDVALPLIDVLLAAQLYREALTVSEQLVAARPGDGVAYVRLAQAQRNLGDNDGAAERSLYKAVEYGFPIGALHREFGLLYERQGKTAAAIEAYQQALKEQNGADRPLLYRTLGRLLVDEGRLDEAVAVLQEAVAVVPEPAPFHAELGALYRGLGNPEAAIGAYRQALAHGETRHLVYETLGQLLVDEGRLDEAVAVLQEAVAVVPEPARFHAELGALYRGLGDRSAAIAAYRQALAHGETGHLVYETLGQLLVDEGRLDEAVMVLQEAVAVVPEPARFHARLRSLSLEFGSLLHSQGNIVAAIDAYRQALAYGERGQAVYSALSQLLIEAGRRDEAVALLEEAVGVVAEPGIFYTRLAALQVEQANHSAAIQAYQEALAHGERGQAVYSALSQLLIEAGRRDEAVALLEEAVGVVAEPASLYATLASLLEADGDRAAALAVQQQAVAQAPTDVPSLIRMATMLHQQGDLIQAEAYANQAVGLAPENAPAHASRAMILEALGRREEAGTHYLRALQLDPYFVPAYEGWIRVHINVQHQPFAVDLTALASALAEISTRTDSTSLWAQTLLASGYERLEGASPRVYEHLQAALQLDPGFPELYRLSAEYYEGVMDARRARANWSSYRSLASDAGAGTEADARITRLLQREIQRPPDGAQVAGIIEIVGTATDPAFQFYKVEYRPQNAPVEWAVIGELGQTPVIAGSLVTWDASSVPPGAYQLRLTVVDNTGNYGPQDVITVWVEGGT